MSPHSVLYDITVIFSDFANQIQSDLVHPSFQERSYVWVMRFVAMGANHRVSTSGDVYNSDVFAWRSQEKEAQIIVCSPHQRNP